MNRYEVLYHDRHTEIVDEDTVNDLIAELESFDRTDVSQIHQLNDDDSLGDTIWTEEEGLFPTDFFDKYYGDYDDYIDDVLDVSASEVDDLARDVLGDTEFEIAYDEDDNTVGTNVKTLVVDIISSEYPDIDLGSVPARVISALENMIEEGYLTEDSLNESTLTAEEKVDAWHAGTRRENYKAAGIPKLQTFLDIAKRKGYSEIVDIINSELIKRGVAPASAVPVMGWEDLIKAADELLNDLCIKSGNDDWDDGDGYWSGEEGHVWCNRNIYCTDKLNNSDKLEKLCDEYSKKLPNVVFYYTEDDFFEDPVSQIGYEATNPDFKEDSDWD